MHLRRAIFRRTPLPPMVVAILVETRFRALHFIETAESLQHAADIAVTAEEVPVESAYLRLLG